MTETLDSRFIDGNLNFSHLLAGGEMEEHPSESQPPIRVFVASTDAEWLPATVLEFSIREHCSQPVSVTKLYTTGRRIPVPRDKRNRPRTPFSFQRFLIPELCGYEGRAIYLDADMLVFSDIAEMWNGPLAGYDLQTVEAGDPGRAGQYSVMLLNCERLRWNVDEIVSDLDRGVMSYEELMYEMCRAPSKGSDIPPRWNSLERFKAGETALLHYTDMNTQPWISKNNPLGEIWIECLIRALESGLVKQSDIDREIDAGHVRPSLGYQVGNRVLSSFEIPSVVAKQDRSFVPPFKRVDSSHGRPWTSPLAAVAAFTRRAYYSSFVPRLLGGLKRR